MGKIFDALEKFSKEHGNRAPGRIRNSDYRVLLEFDLTTGRLKKKAPGDSARLRRLMTYRLVDSQGKLTPAGISKLLELHGNFEDHKPANPQASATPAKQAPQVTGRLRLEQLSASEWAVLMKYDRKSGNLLGYDRRTGQLDKKSTAILSQPDIIQRLIDAGMIMNGGWLTPEAKRQCARIEQALNRKRSPDSRQQLKLPISGRARKPSATFAGPEPPAQEKLQNPSGQMQMTEPVKESAAKDLTAIRLEEDAQQDENKTEDMRPRDLSTPALKKGHSALKHDTGPQKRHGQPISEKKADSDPPKFFTGGRHILNKSTVRYDKQAVDKNLVSLFDPESFEAEQFKILRTNLLFPASGAAPRSIMVTSALPGEGKSFVAANLAVSIARHVNRSVLLIDCDLRRPSIHRLFGLGDSRGLADYLSRGNALPSLLIKSGVEHLTVLPAGRPPANPSELLSSERMNDLIAEVSARYRDRLIIIDSPPPRLAAESGALARQVDGILLVVKYASTPRDIVTELIDKLGPEKVLGAIVNNFEMNSPFYARKYYGYYGKAYKKK